MVTEIAKRLPTSQNGIPATDYIPSSNITADPCHQFPPTACEQKICYFQNKVVKKLLGLFHFLILRLPPEARNSEALTGQ